MPRQIPREQTELKESLKRVGYSESEARSMAYEVVQRGNAAHAFDILFNRKIRSVMRDFQQKVDRSAKTVVDQNRAYNLALEELVSGSKRPRDKQVARENLEALGIPEEEVNWALNERTPIDLRWCTNKINRLRQQGKSLAKARREVLETAARDRVIVAVMDGEVTELGSISVTAIVMIILAVISAVLAVAAWIYDMVKSSQLEKEAEKLFRERQEAPLEDSEIQLNLLPLLIELRLETWEEVRAATLRFLVQQRSGRNYFVGDEEERVKRYWDEHLRELREEAKEERIVDRLSNLFSSRERRAGETSQVRRTETTAAYNVLARINQQITASSRSVLLENTLKYGVPTLAIAGGIYALYRVTR